MNGAQGLSTNIPFPSRYPRDRIEPVGKGGLSVGVFRAWNEEKQNYVAVKVILPAYESAHERAYRESAAQSELDHPGIVRIHSWEECQGFIFIEMEYVADGRSLDDELRACRQHNSVILWREAVRWCQEIAEALHHAHEKGVIHRDLKPQNILITPDRKTKIADFGLAKQTSLQSQGLTGPGQQLGTPHYMSPEQAQGESRHAMPAMDIYSLGAILYELLTNNVPFHGATREDTFRMIADEKLRPRKPRLLRQRELPRSVSDIAMTCLHKRPQDRYTRAKDLAKDLSRALEGDKPLDARPEPLRRQLADELRRNFGDVRWLFGVAIVVAPVIVVFHFIRAVWPVFGARAKLAEDFHISALWPALFGVDFSLNLIFFVVLGLYAFISFAGLLTASRAKPDTLLAAVRAGGLVGGISGFLLALLSTWLFGAHAGLRPVQEDLRLLGDAVWGKSRTEAREELEQRFRSIPEEERSRAYKRLLTNKIAFYAWPGAASGLIWAILVGCVMLVVGTFWGMRLLGQDGDLSSVFWIYMAAVFPLTLVIARLADTFFFAPHFTGWWTPKHTAYIEKSLLACAWLSLVASIALVPRFSRWDWTKQLGLFVVLAVLWLPAYFAIFRYSRTEIYTPSAMRLMWEDENS